VEKADATGLFLVALHEVGLDVGMIFYFEFPYTARVNLHEKITGKVRAELGGRKKQFVLGISNSTGISSTNYTPSLLFNTDHDH